MAEPEKDKTTPPAKEEAKQAGEETPKDGDKKPDTEARMAKFEESLKGVDERLGKIEALLEEAEKEIENEGKGTTQTAPDASAEMKAEMAKQGKAISSFIEDYKKEHKELRDMVAELAQHGKAKTAPSTSEKKLDESEETAKKLVERFGR